MTTTTTRMRGPVLTAIVIAAGLSTGCRLGSAGSTMQHGQASAAPASVGATQHGAHTANGTTAAQPDTRAPTERDPKLAVELPPVGDRTLLATPEAGQPKSPPADHAGHGSPGTAGASNPTAAQPTDIAPHEMKAMGGMMRAMGKMMKAMGEHMKTSKPDPEMATAMAEMGTAVAEIASMMTEMGDRMATGQPSAGKTPPPDPMAGKQTGDKMKTMGGKMKRAGDKMKTMGDQMQKKQAPMGHDMEQMGMDMMEMGGGMMEMGDMGMGGMGDKKMGDKKMGDKKMGDKKGDAMKPMGDQKNAPKKPAPQPQPQPQPQPMHEGHM